jgi:acyl-CoA reductase-like NAD-dependent aldehyde dehydrogenase
MQAKDDYDHAVFIHAARDERAFVMDPLGRRRYGGAWVSKADLRQFASRFTTATGSPYCAVVKRGAESSVERARRQMRQARGLRADLVAARSAITTARAQALRDAARAIATLPR